MSWQVYRMEVASVLVAPWSAASSTCYAENEEITYGVSHI